MRTLRVVTLLLFVPMIFVVAGCDGSAPNPNVDAEGKAITAPVRPGLKKKAADQMKKVMPHS